jgi:hypothetical protein
VAGKGLFGMTRARVFVYSAWCTARQGLEVVIVVGNDLPPIAPASSGDAEPNRKIISAARQPMVIIVAVLNSVTTAPPHHGLLSSKVGHVRLVAKVVDAHLVCVHGKKKENKRDGEHRHSARLVEVVAMFE